MSVVLYFNCICIYVKCEVLRVLSVSDSVVYLWLAQIAPITHFDFVPFQGQHQLNKADLLIVRHTYLHCKNPCLSSFRPADSVGLKLFENHSKWWWLPYALAGIFASLASFVVDVDG